MNWNLVDSDGAFIAYVDQYTYRTVNSLNTAAALVFHGTRDYVDGVIFAFELMGLPKFTPKMIEHGVHSKAE